MALLLCGYHVGHVHAVSLPWSNTVRPHSFAAALRARGHRCVLEETSDWNLVELVVSGELVFRCHIKQLHFGEFFIFIYFFFWRGLILTHDHHACV